MPIEAAVPTRTPSSLSPTSRNGSASVAKKSSVGRGPIGLSARQLTIGRLICDGLSSRQIGARLGLSKSTVECHRMLLRMKLGARSTVELMDAMIRKKLWTPT